jgi:hypothetical protein
MLMGSGFPDSACSRLRLAAQGWSVDVVLTAHGLGSFQDEYARSVTCDIDGVSLRVLPLERITTTALEATLLARREKD